MNERKINPYDLILCSASPRRQELLRLLNQPFRVAVAVVDEETIASELLGSYGNHIPVAAAGELALSLAKAKASAVADCEQSIRQPSFYLGADTIVYHRGEILGKPRDYSTAVRILRQLSGQTHSVLTAVALFKKTVHSKSAVFLDGFISRTEVSFHPLDELQELLIQSYVESRSPFDKAGGYGIQDAGSLLIDSIHGDYYTVVGLPVAQTYRLLQQCVQNL